MHKGGGTQVCPPRPPFSERRFAALHFPPLKLSISHRRRRRVVSEAVSTAHGDLCERMCVRLDSSRFPPPEGVLHLLLTSSVHGPPGCCRNATSAKARRESLKSLLAADIAAVVAAFQRPVFTWAAIAGDNVLLHALHEGGHLASDRVKARPHTRSPPLRMAAAAAPSPAPAGRPRRQVLFIDTLHLFPETRTLLAEVEAAYGFKAVVATPVGAATKAEWNKVYSSDLYMTNPDEYDQKAKVEPLSRSLAELAADAWINGRRRDHGAERALLPVFEAGSPVKARPAAQEKARQACLGPRPAAPRGRGRAAPAGEPAGALDVRGLLRLPGRLQRGAPPAPRRGVPLRGRRALDAAGAAREVVPVRRRAQRPLPGPQQRRRCAPPGGGPSPGGLRGLTRRRGRLCQDGVRHPQHDGRIAHFFQLDRLQLVYHRLPAVVASRRAPFLGCAAPNE